MPKVRVNDISMNYEQQGTGEPLVLIPYLAADNDCYAFQVADYAKQFTCISIDSAERVRRTNRRAIIPLNYSPMMLQHSCRPSAWNGLIVLACRSARPPVCGSPPNILNGSSRYPCIAVGPKATRFSRLWWRAGRRLPRAWAMSPR
jgi:hypothetical protein